MKNLLILLVALISFSAFSYDVSDITGTFRVNLKGSPVYNLVTILEDGQIKLIEYSNYGELECRGRSNVKDDVMYSDMVCLNGRRFSQAIMLSDIYELEGNTNTLFKVRVISTLFGGRTKLLTFKRVD